MANHKQNNTTRSHVDDLSNPAHHSQQKVIDLRSLVEQREAQKEAQAKKIQAQQERQQRQERQHQQKALPKKPKSTRSRLFALTQKRTAKPKKQVEQTQPKPAAKVHKAKTVKKTIPSIKQQPKQPRNRVTLSMRLEQYSWYSPAVAKPLGIFILFCLVFIIPVSVSASLRTMQQRQQVIMQSTQEAFTHLQDAASSIRQFDFILAESQFQAAQYSFEQAQHEIDSMNSLVVQLAAHAPVKGKVVKSGIHVVEAGQELSLAGQQMAQTASVLSSIDLSERSKTDEEGGLTDVLVLAHAGLAPTLEHIATANDALAEVSIKVVPPEHQELFALVQTMLPTVEQQLNESVNVTELLLSFLGHNQDKRYLVIFGNNREIRPSGGGFPGSLGLFDISKGVVTQSSIPGGGIYDIAGQSQVHLVPPQPLQLVNQDWNIQDSLWFPHYPASAQKVQWFMEHTNGGVSVDGVISLTPDVVEDLLTITGPIDLTEQYGVTIDAENFYLIVQTEAEKKYDENPKSKQMIADMTPLLMNAVMEKAKDPQALLQMVTVLKAALEQKDIVVYVNDQDVQRAFSQQNWAGELMDTDRDYLHVSVANIAGGKTSQVVDHAVNVDTVIQEDGSIVNTVKLTNVHKGDTTNIFENTNNISFVRFYVPQGSRLISTDGFNTPDSKLFHTPSADNEIDEDVARISGDVSINPATEVYTNSEFNKDVIGGWIQTPVHDSTTVTIQYQLPFSLDTNSWWNRVDHYSLLVQKQSGLTITVNHDIQLPPTLKVTSSYPGEYTDHDQVVLDHDYFRGFIVEQAD